MAGLRADSPSLTPAKAVIVLANRLTFRCIRRVRSVSESAFVADFWSIYCRGSFAYGAQLNELALNPSSKMLASARTMSTAGKSPTFKHALSTSAHALETPPAPRIKQRPTLSLVLSHEGDATSSGPGLGLTMRDILPHRALYENAITKLRAGVGLGLDLSSRDAGSSGAPATSRLACSGALSNSGSRCSNSDTVEGQALNAITSSKLYMRRRQAIPPLPSIAIASSNDSSLRTKTSLPLSANIPLSPAMSAIHAYSSSSPIVAGTSLPTSSEDSVVKGLDDSSSTPPEDVGGQEIVFEDDEWEYVKPVGLKSCKGRVCTPFALKSRWLL